MKIANSSPTRFALSLIAVMLLCSAVLIGLNSTTAQAAEESISIGITAPTQPEAFTKAQAQNAKITGCWWLISLNTWFCIAKTGNPPQSPDFGAKSIILTGPNQPQIYSEAQARGAQIVGCWWSADFQLWFCKALLVDSTSTSSSSTSTSTSSTTTAVEGTSVTTAPGDTSPDTDGSDTDNTDVLGTSVTQGDGTQSGGSVQVAGITVGGLPVTGSEGYVLFGASLILLSGGIMFLLANKRRNSIVG